MSKAKPLGSYRVQFKGAKDSLETLFGTKALDTGEMTKKLWGYVKRKKLIKRV